METKTMGINREAAMRENFKLLYDGVDPEPLAKKQYNYLVAVQQTSKPALYSVEAYSKEEADQKILEMLNGPGCHYNHKIKYLCEGKLRTDIPLQPNK
jgi:hypothetical protein